MTNVPAFYHIVTRVIMIIVTAASILITTMHMNNCSQKCDKECAKHARVPKKAQQKIILIIRRIKAKSRG